MGQMEGLRTWQELGVKREDGGCIKRECGCVLRTSARGGGALKAISSVPITVQPREERECLRSPSHVGSNSQGFPESTKQILRAGIKGATGKQTTLLPSCWGNSSSSIPRDRAPHSPRLAPASPHTVHTLRATRSSLNLWPLCRAHPIPRVSETYRSQPHLPRDAHLAPRRRAVAPGSFFLSEVQRE